MRFSKHFFFQNFHFFFNFFLIAKIEAIKYSKEKIPSGTLCVLTGWGSTDHAGNSPTPNDLNELTNIPTMDTKECQDYSNDMEFVTDHNLCTKNAHEGHCKCCSSNSQ